MVLQVASNLERVEKILLRWHCLGGLDKPADVQNPVSMGCWQLHKTKKRHPIKNYFQPLQKSFVLFPCCSIKDTHGSVTFMSRLTLSFSFPRSFVGLGQDEQPPESLAIESMLYDNEEGYFGGLYYLFILLYIFCLCHMPEKQLFSKN